ncbi:hypothetical protein LOTGIDRAFT_208879 [Lottia gigantea]|uniref:Peroxisomal membrane protein 2 n=1 Tax=Lottia gigantea TaxID=225164 RepID=V4C7Q2_LOTGI|nr:hypothetical protein LOTGIDRAFT_208879 [Lottia gigantea]ESO97734.1 hypothetical protein LOTGIDRAFT_208879 [Lottia gigantea]
MSFSKPENETCFEKLLREYNDLLQRKPVLTKAVSSSIISAVGNILSQLLAPHAGSGGKIVWRSTFAYSCFALMFNGPLLHFFHQYLDNVVPKKKDKTSAMKRVIFDRFIFAPPYLFIYLYVIALLEGHGTSGAKQRIKEVYWMLLQLNWKIWTFVQYFNLTYVPAKYRVLFGNLVSLIWTTYISTKRNNAQ